MSSVKAVYNIIIILQNTGKWPNSSQLTRGWWHEVSFREYSLIYMFHLSLSHYIDYIDGLVQDCSNSIANALELLQSCTKLSICDSTLW